MLEDLSIGIQSYQVDKQDAETKHTRRSDNKQFEFDHPMVIRYC